MEIQNICRTCLGLSGPLMSIFDDSGSSSSLSQMLSDITKTRPNRFDNLPEKVCLSCISEINHCYSFKLKCENSNRTLRQLLPDAQPEDIENMSKISVQMINKLMQTDGVITSNVSVQTTNEKILKFEDQEVQTDLLTNDVATSPSNTKDNRSLKKIDTNKKSNLELIYTPNASKRYSTRLHTAQENFQKTLKRKHDDNFEQELKLQDENAIVLEVHEVEVDDESIYVEHQVQPLIRKSIDEFSQSGATYHELSNTRFVYEDTVNSKRSNEQPTEESLIEETELEEYNDIVVESTTDSNNVQDDQPNYSFKIYNDENGETAVLAQKQKCDFKCPNCIMSFVFEKALKRHLVKRHGWNEVGQQSSTKQIEITEAEEPQDSAVVSEVVRQLTIKDSIAVKLKHFCPNCKAGFALRKSLMYHMKREICASRSFKCDKCERVFISVELLKEHRSTHILDNMCTVCTKGPFGTQDDLNQHMIDEHNRSKRNQCNICKKVFTMLSSLKDHMRIHSGEKPFQCHLCDKAFNQNANLKQHLMRHSNVKNFKCDECDDSFVTKGELFSHKRTHNGDTPFTCEFCSTSFTSSSSLAKHKRKHTGERPYACEICPMRFSALNVLKNHRRTHTGEKPFKCPYCEKRFIQKGDCQGHLRTHTGGRHFTCSCGQKFKCLRSCREHMKMHSDDKSKHHIQKVNEKNMAISKTDAIHVTIVDTEDEEQHVVVAARKTIQQKHLNDLQNKNKEKTVQLALDNIC